MTRLEPPRPGRPSAGRLSAALRGGWLLVREMAGEREYEKYVEHQRRHHAGQPILGEREFWRAYVDRKDREPAARCC